jgi:OOP family OmpA-OmpF porin
MFVSKVGVAAAIAMAAAIASPLTLAQDQGWYVGVSIGQSEADEGIASDMALITSGSVDAKDTGWKLYGGFTFNRNFGIELAYVDLGKAKYSGDFFGLPVTGGTIEATGFNMAAIGAIPLSSALSLFGKVGIFSWEAEANDTTAGLPFSQVLDGNDLFFGVGASYSFTRNLSMRGEWERFQLDDTDVDLLSIGLAYRF